MIIIFCWQDGVITNDPHFVFFFVEPCFRLLTSRIDDAGRTSWLLLISVLLLSIVGTDHDGNDNNDYDDDDGDGGDDDGGIGRD